MNFNDLIDWLFHKTSMKPQLGFAGADKKAWCWLPGAKSPKHETITRAMEQAPLKGASQCAYTTIFEPMAGQTVEICWVGLDIDADDNPNGYDYRAIYLTKPSMIRTSCSGKGIHVIYRLEQPVICSNETANAIIKAITKPLMEAVTPNKVCKADKRMFWLMGSRNERIYQSDFLLKTDTAFPEPILVSKKDERVDFEPTPFIREWLGKLGVTGVRKSMPIYVGDVVSLLRGLGEKVETVSSCRGNGQINGYLNVARTSISLFAYADGHTIWSISDVEAIINAD